MRKPTAYENYLCRMEAYYKIKKLEKPEWICQAKEYYSHLFYSARSVSEMCSNTNIPKSTMEYLANLDSTEYERK